MRIVLDLRFIEKGYSPSAGILFVEVITEMAIRNKSHSFTLLINKPNGIDRDLPGNLTIHSQKKTIIDTLFGKWWLNRWLFKQLEMLKADLFVAIDDLHAVSQKVPCCLFVTNLNFLMRGLPGNEKLLSFANKAKIAFRRARVIITNSEHDRQIIEQQFDVPAEKINLWSLQGRGNIKTLSWAEKESVKTRYAGGREYFIFAGDIHERHCLISLLKSFSEFKKWQHSNMQMVFAGNNTPWSEQLKERMASFKFRDDVHIVTDPSTQDLTILISGAYAFLYPALYDHFPINIVHAMHAGVPVITSAVPVIRELAGDSVIYAEPEDTGAFATRIQQIYKDENLRTTMIDAAKKHISERTEKDMADDLWEFLQQTYNSKS